MAGAATLDRSRAVAIFGCLSYPAIQQEWVGYRGCRLIPGSFSVI